MKVLVVEDDQMISELYKEILTDEGFSVDTAMDGNSALQKMQQGGWDVVLLDILIPVIDGVEVIRRIQQKPPQIPNKHVIFLTNLDSGEKMEEVKSLGYEYIVKSKISPDELVTKVKQYMS